MDVRVLAISTHGILNGLAYGKVRPEELEDAIFFLGENWPADIVELAEYIHGDVIDWTTKRDTCNHFLGAIRTAQDEGRLDWWNTGPSWTQLNGLLKRNGLPEITPVEGDTPPSGRFAYPLVEEAVNAQRHPYKVVWV